VNESQIRDAVEAILFPASEDVSFPSRPISMVFAKCSVEKQKKMSATARYYHEDRTHLGLEKDAPAGRPTAIGTKAESKIQSFPRLGGLHHRYAVAA
jgi:hypothetical protein